MKTIISPRACARVGVLAILLVATACSEADEPTAPAAPALASTTLSSAFQQVSTGGAANCGLATDGRAYCWGSNRDGQLGDGTRESRNVPTVVAGGLVFRNIAAGNSTHVCGVTTDYHLYCWGSNSFGELGDGTTENRLVPTRVKGQRTYAIATIGYFHTCAIAKDTRRAYCWGQNGIGQLGDGTKTNRHAPVAVAGGRAFHQLDAGDFHTCGVTPADRAFCWGNAGAKPGALPALSPAAVAGTHAFTQISAGIQNTCAVTTDQRAFCWGHGPNGDGTLHQWFRPDRVVTDLRFRQVLAGQVMCGLSTAGKAYCWGSGGDNLGDGKPYSHTNLLPVAVVGGHTFSQLSVDGGTCGKTREGVIWCWGYGGSGGLGNGSDASSAVPVRVNDPQG